MLSWSHSLLQASSSIWPCTVSASAVDSGPSGLLTWRTSVTRIPVRAATRPPGCLTWACTPTQTLSTTSHKRSRRAPTRQRTCRRPTATPLATRCTTPTWTRSAPKSTSPNVDTGMLVSTRHTSPGARPQEGAASHLRTSSLTRPLLGKTKQQTKTFGNFAESAERLGFCFAQSRGANDGRKKSGIYFEEVAGGEQQQTI